MGKCYFLILIFGLASLNSFGQDDEYSYGEETGSIEDEYWNSDIRKQRFDREKWEALTQDIDYTEPERQSTNPQSSFPAFLVSLLKILAIVIVVIIVAVLLFYLLGVVSAPKNKQIKKGTVSAISLEHIEENLVESDLPSFIRRALQEQNFALAIRLYYLNILQAMTRKKIITWKKDKTNQDYLNELNSSSFKSPFQKVTAIFERIWYGDRPLAEEDFKAIEHQFKSLVDEIDRHQP